MNKKIIATVQMSSGSLTKKISAIKLVRSVFGIGLVEAKKFVEDNGDREVQVIMNAEQFASVIIRGAYDRTSDCPEVYINVYNGKYVDTGIDFSAVTPY